MRVRPATPADRETLLGLWDEWVASEPPPPWAPRDARAGTAAGIDESIRLGAAFVAEVAGEVAGFAAALPRGEAAAELTELYVRPARRGGGVARLLVAEILRAARARGARHVFVATAPESDARRIYERWGFHPQSLELVAALDELERSVGGCERT